jgi:hypothetical protein
MRSLQLEDSNENLSPDFFSFPYYNLMLGGCLIETSQGVLNRPAAQTERKLFSNGHFVPCEKPVAIIGNLRGGQQTESANSKGIADTQSRFLRPPFLAGHIRLTIRRNLHEA